jgi:hypothetical protein
VQLGDLRVGHPLQTPAQRFVLGLNSLMAVLELVQTVPEAGI